MGQRPERGGVPEAPRPGARGGRPCHEPGVRAPARPRAAHRTGPPRASRPADPLAPDFIRKYVDWGAGPRAGLFLIWGAKAFAAMDARFTVSLDDIRRVAVPVMRHRIACNFAAPAEGLDSVALVAKLLEAVPEPDIPKFEPRPPRDVHQLDSAEA